MKKLLDMPVPEWLGPLLAWRVVVLFLLYACLALLPDIFDVAAWSGHFRFPAGGEEPLLADTLKTWDGNRYLAIAANGYEAGDPTAAWYPLWPFMIRLAAPLLGGSYLAASIVLANLFAVAALLALHSLVRARLDAVTADTTLLLVMAFPGAMFFALPYSESLFLLLVVLMFLWLAQGRDAWAAVPAFLLPMTRPVGVLVIAPLLLHAALRKGRPLRPQARDLWALTPLLGWAAYLLWMFLETGNAFEGFDAQDSFFAQSSVAKLFDITGFVGRFVGAAAALHGVTTSYLDRIWFLWLLLCLPAIGRLDRSWLGYALLLGVVQAMGTGSISYTRYALVLFPVFVVTAAWLVRPGREKWRWPLLGLFGGLQVLMLIRHVNNMWAG